MAPRPTLLVLHYDGGAFAGWQRQAEDRTVQSELEAALEKLTGRATPVVGAGRTDAGVHAVGQAAAAVVPARWQPGELVRALNAVIAPDIWIASAQTMVAGFNPRRHAIERTYCYRIGLGDDARSPFRRRWEWALPGRLDEPLLHASAALFSGEHGFQALSAAGQPKEHYRCRVLEALWQRREDAAGFEFWITADRFLHRMVRFVVGLSVDVARGRRPLDDVLALLDAVDNQRASPPAPPQGLFLVGVRYPASCYATMRD
jgi:tRNA pseudouridine38-40 synthase